MIPDGCKELSDKNAHITQVIQYLENSYLSAVHTGSDAERISINIQAKTHVVDILSRVAGDIESLASKLEYIYLYILIYRYLYLYVYIYIYLFIWFSILSCILISCILNLYILYTICYILYSKLYFIYLCS